MKSINFLLAGVGGQGVLTSSDIVAEAGLAAGYDAKKSEIHGFSQRGGVVESHVRWADKVFSPVSPPGQVDFLIAFEPLESARWIDWLRPGGVVLADPHPVDPLSVSAGDQTYPDMADIEAALRARTAQVVFVEGLGIAQRLGNPRMANTVLLGALSTYLDVPVEMWLQVVGQRLKPKYVEANHKAFLEGRETLG
ncbi:MAG: indolepyruvate ferredoxin oxidoreductase [Anaerolineaceae bacterium 4572_32.1]|nr:MAG: indolepyruvate ferredoxin oxidoreductase [Anaerolineaceae bacterium 4572_32.1]